VNILMIKNRLDQSYSLARFIEYEVNITYYEHEKVHLHSLDSHLLTVSTNTQKIMILHFYE